MLGVAILHETKSAKLNYFPLSVVFAVTLCTRNRIKLTLSREQSTRFFVHYRSNRQISDNKEKAQCFYMSYYTYYVMSLFVNNANVDKYPIHYIQHQINLLPLRSLDYHV